DRKNSAGCVKAFLLGDIKDCDLKKLKLPDDESCKLFQNQTDLKTKENIDHLVMKEFMENYIYRYHLDADDLCEEMSVNGDTMWKQIKTSLEATPGKSHCANYFC
uniref:Uncharacterized protein n=1 Tax=Strigamia maritima TaxID=126957 RepID=T1IMG8_STRMM